MLAQQGITATELIGNRDRVKQIKASDFIDERFGLPTILDILSELENPAATRAASFRRPHLPKVSTKSATCKLA